MSKQLDMHNGQVIDANAPACPECGSKRTDRRPDGDRLGPSEYYVCANGHTFSEGDL